MKHEWKSTTSEFESSKFDYTLTTKSANNGTFNANFRPTFDDTKYKVEIFNNDKLVKTVEKSTTSQAVALEPGANKVVIRISDLTNEKNYTDYKFDITRTRSTTATLAFSGATIVPSERALISNPTYKGRSEGTFFRLENGELTKVAGISPTISDYKAFLYKDINSFDLNISPKDSWSIVRASIDDGEAVNVEKGKPIKNIKFGDKNSVKIKIQICSNSKYYANKEAGKEDPFEAENTYTITVERLSVDKSELQITSADISSGQWCTPEFNKDIVTAAILIPKDCNSLDINFKVTNGATVYKDSKSDANLLNAEEDGNYKLTIDTSKITSSLTQRIVLYKVLEDGSEMITTYTFTIYKRGKLVGMPDKVVDYFCPGSQYSNMGNYGLYPEKSLIGSGNWYTPISLGNFGGSITYYYENGIKNDPTNPYGIDFTIFGNSNGGQSFSEPGNVIVSKDGVNWYTLAGSEHYDDKAIWGYELTYIRNGNGTACSYKDSLGKSDDMTAMYKYALKENYPLHKFDADADKQVTVKGTLLVNDSKDPYGSSAAAYPDFGYVDVHTNSSTVAGTGENVDLLTVPVGNPYTGNYNKYGDGFDLDWAVDEDSTYIPQELIEEFGGRIYIIPPYQHLFSYMKTLIKLFKTNKYSIVHSHINSLSIFPLCAAQIAKVKIRIAHSHSSSGNNEFKRNIIKYILRPFSKVFPNCFFACSNFAGRWLFGKKFMDSGKIIILNNAIDTSKFSYNKEIRKSIRKKETLEGKFVVGHVGRFVNQKNHEFLIDIFYEIHKMDKNTELLLFGDGPLRQNIEIKVKNLKLESNVKFMGIKQNINEYMQAMDIFLLPSFYEGLPVVGVEAQTSGLSCIFSTNVTEEAKLIEDTIYIDLDKGAKYWAEQALQFKETQRKDKSSLIAERGFDIKKEARKLQNYYLNLLGKEYGTN